MLALVSAGSAASSGAAHAQSVREVVRDHVARELDKDDPKEASPQGEPHTAERPQEDSRPAEKSKAKPKTKPKPAAEPSTASEGGAGFVLSTDAPAQPGPRLPQRILGRNLQIDLKLGAGYRGWVPQQYESAEVEAGSYYVFSVDVRARIFRFVNLRRGYYEGNGLAGPRTREAAVVAEIGSYVPKAAWLLGVLGFPIFTAWEPIIRYESRAYETTARPRQPVCVVTDAVANDLSACVRTTDPLRMTSGFETLVLGVRYDQSKEKGGLVETRKEKLPPLSFGIGLMSYRKPYQVTIDGNTLSEYLFDGRFRGAGLMFGTEAGGGPDRLFVDLDAQFGLGEVALTRNVKLNTLAPEDWLMGYVQGNVTLGYHWPIVRSAPTLMLVPSASGGGASFFFFKTQGEPDARDEVATVNWDFLWNVHLAVVLSL